MWHQIYVKSIKEKYGVENAFQAEICKEKIKKTNLERYGVECSLQNKEVRNKGIETCLRKYGVKNAGGAPEVLEKIKSDDVFDLEQDFDQYIKIFTRSINHNYFLTQTEIDSLINQLFACEESKFSPNGESIFKVLKMEDLNNLL